ncbi:copper resistance CopC family protein [Arthrobacter sp. NEB 688]|uniref:copper resistance CopC family protein n=1 Tax=Arthrobacter sp. NEB 688 TaxID=904039 RepID=UPI001564372A|nr:copper resistance CopC family protein [Arthrobacter sp. NEB 688]QKE85220.1 copper resistance protein CopC [Arthrobacter sp. NEB 688]
MSAARTRRGWSARLVAVLAAVVGLALAAATPAAAHTGLEGSSPADGSTLRRAPTTLVLRFADPVVPGTAVGALDGPGGRHSLRAPTVRGATVRLRLDGPATPGRYTLAWRVVAADGHPVSGTLTFRVSPAPAAAASPSVEASAAPAAPDRSGATGAPAEPATDALAVVEGAGSGDPATTPTAGGPLLAWGLLAGLVALGAAGPAVLRGRRRAPATEVSS